MQLACKDNNERVFFKLGLLIEGLKDCRKMKLCDSFCCCGDDAKPEPESLNEVTPVKDNVDVSSHICLLSVDIF